MNITKEIISDLLPLYVANECSPDTRALVEDYLQRNPQEATALRRIMSTALSETPLPAARLDEIGSLREARRRLRLRSGLLATAIFFSLMPLSFCFTGEKTWWMLRDAPMSALAYGILGAAGWVAYAIERHRSRGL
jgi:hypothetical protein